MSSKPKKAVSSQDFRCIWVWATPLDMVARSLADKQPDRPKEANEAKALESIREGDRKAQPYLEHPFGMLIEKDSPRSCFRIAFSRTSTGGSHLGFSHSVEDHGHQDCKVISKDGVIQTDDNRILNLRVSSFLGLRPSCSNDAVTEVGKIFEHLKSRFAGSHICIQEEQIA